MKLKEKFEKAKKLKIEDNVDGFDYIYFKSTRRKHDSGYYMFEIYGEKEKEIYILSKCSDVIDFNKIVYKFGWFASIDIPEPSIFRLFPRRKEKIYVPFRGCSSFEINFFEEED